MALAELTVFEAEETMKAALADGYLVDPEVTVQEAEHRSQRVEVLGAVANAGLYYLEGPTTVRQLIAKAGGLKQEQGGLVLVTRADQTTRIGAVDLEGPRGGMTLMAGDVVTVDSGGSVVYLAGEVSKPGPVQFSEGMTLSEALIRAGGSSNLGRLAGTYILRGEEKIVVNLKRVLKGKDADFVLRPGDRVVIPESPI